MCLRKAARHLAGVSEMRMNYKGLLTLIYAVAILFTLMPITIAGSENPTSSLNLIFVTDTSATMSGKGKGLNIFPQVREAMKDFVDDCKVGDNVVLITYDSEVHVYPTAAIYGPEDKVALKRQIDGLRANGQWTHTTAA